MSTPVPVLILLHRPSRDAPGVSGGASGVSQVDANHPHLSVQDLGVTRGDGIFETISVCGGRPQALQPHLDRFANSARLLDLPAPDLDAFRLAVLAAIEAHGEVAELFVKIVFTRGVEVNSAPSGVPTGWAYAEQVGDFSAARTAGIRVVTLDRGYRHDVAQTSPWLLQGAKSLSYAVNKAALREAARRGADDVIFVSGDGYVLEGPTSNVILRRGNTLVTPRTDQGILAGTTQASVFEYARSLGLETEYALVRPDELLEADALWLVSSVRQSVPVNNLDGVDRAVDAELSAGMLAALIARTE